MKRGFGIILFMAIVLIGAYYSYTINYYSKDLLEFNQIVLNYQIDNCTDASIEEVLNSPDLGTDYTKKDFLKIDPQIAIDTFIDYFLLSNRVPVIQENKDLVKLNYIGAVLVASYDGYYIGIPTKVGYANNDLNAGLWDLTLSMKNPYSLENGVTTYALNMGASSGYAVAGNTLNVLKTSPMGLTRDETFRHITSIISTDLAYTLDTVNRMKTYYANTLYIPTALTNISNVNPIEGPTIMIVMQDVDLFSNKPLNAFSIGGAVIEKNRMVAGYTRAGTKYYTYVDLAPPIAIEEMFNSIGDAARAGYHADIKYIQ